MTIIEKIEDRIKEFKKNNPAVNINNNFLFDPNRLLEWVLSELKKQDCNNCALNLNCFNSIELMKPVNGCIQKTVNYCSLFIEVKND